MFSQEPQLRFIGCCATETWYPQCYCAEDRLDPTGTVLGQRRCARCGATTGAWFDGAVTVVVPQLHFIEGRRTPSAVAVCFLVVDALFCRSCLLCPLLFSTGAHGSDSAEFVEVPQSQFLPGCGRRRVNAATSCLATVKSSISVHRRSQWTFQSPQRQVRTVSAVHGGPGGDKGQFATGLQHFRPPSFWTLMPRVAGTPGV